MTCESKPRVILVGSHLDELDEKDADEKLKASSDILQKALQLKSRLLERAIVPNKMYYKKSH